MRSRAIGRAGTRFAWLGVMLLGSLLRPPIAGAGPGPSVLRAELPNGVRLILSRQSAVPIVAMSCLVDGGARVDPPDRPGLAALTAALLEEGTKGRSAQDIARIIDSLGGSFSTSAAADWISAGSAVLARDFDTGIDLVARSLLEPTFPSDAIERVRGEMLGSLEASEEQPGYVAARAFRGALFGDAPYGHPTEGTPESIKQITRDEIVGFHAAWIRPEETICAIVGDVDLAHMEAQVKQRLAAWPGGRRPSQPRAGSISGAQSVVIDKPITQANIVLGQVGVARRDPDYFPILLMNHILGGGGFTSRLVKTVRDEAGLAYSVSSHFSSTRLPGPFQIVLQTKVESASAAIDLVRREVATLHDGGASEEELRAAQDYLTGNFPLNLDSTAKLAGFLAQVAYFELGDDYIDRYSERVRSVTLEDVRRAAARHLHPEALVRVVVGPAKKLAEQGLDSRPPDETQEKGGRDRRQ